MGVIEYLRASGQLQNVKHVFSVSGGSITAAHLALNWKRYIGTDEEFDAAKSELAAFGQSDLRGRIIRRWLLALPISLLSIYFGSGRLDAWGRSKLLQSEYDRLFKGAALRDLSSMEGAPIVHILSASMTTGKLCSFDASGFTSIDAGSVIKHAAGLVKVAFAVAASSAFPPMFPPLRLDRRELDLSAEDFPTDVDYLTDGGVFDNLGIRKALGEYLADTSADVLLVSDASGSFDWDLDKDFTQILDRTIRTTNILMKRVAELDTEALYATLVEKGLDFRFISISSESHDSDGSFALPAEMKRAAARLRTDLDSFSDLEIRTLIHHGFNTARTYSAGAFVSSSDEELSVHRKEQNQTDYLTESSAIARDDLAKLRRGRNRRLGLINFRDSATLPIVSFPLLGAAMVGYYFLASQDVRSENAALTTEVAELTEAVSELGLAYTGLTETRTVFVATNRNYNPETASFGDELSSDTRFFQTSVGVPPAAENVGVETTSRFFAPSVSVSSTVLERAAVPLSADGFHEALLTDRVDTQEPERVLLFVHDWNTTLSGALRLAAATAVEIDYPGNVLLFSWPSDGSVVSYFQDREDAQISTSSLAEVVSGIADVSELRIDAIATGVGSDLLLQSLEISPGEIRAQFGKIGLLWPHFGRERAAQYAELFPADSAKLTLYTTRSGNVDITSRLLTGTAPVGSPQLFDIAGIEIVNLVGREWPSRDLSLVLDGVPASERPGIRPVAETENTWILNLVSDER